MWELALDGNTPGDDERFLMAGALAITESPNGTTLLFSDQDALAAAVSRFGLVGSSRPIDFSWVDERRNDQEPIHVGTFALIPPGSDAQWADARDAPRIGGPPGSTSAGSDILLHLDPGGAFGDGRHPTTRLLLEHLSERPPGNACLDVGCGTGVLAIAALLAGWSTADAFDVDPAAEELTALNADLNNVRQRLQLGRPAPTQVFELVLANTIAGTLIDLSEHLARWTKVGGTLVLSGILLEREAEVTQRLLRTDVALGAVGRSELDGWVSLEFIRR